MQTQTETRPTGPMRRKRRGPVIAVGAFVAAIVAVGAVVVALATNNGEPEPAAPVPTTTSPPTTTAPPATTSAPATTVAAASVVDLTGIYTGKIFTGVNVPAGANCAEVDGEDLALDCPYPMLSSPQFLVELELVDDGETLTGQLVIGPVGNQPLPLDDRVGEHGGPVEGGSLMMPVAVSRSGEQITVRWDESVGPATDSLPGRCNRSELVFTASIVTDQPMRLVLLEGYEVGEVIDDFGTIGPPCPSGLAEFRDNSALIRQ